MAMAMSMALAIDEKKTVWLDLYTPLRDYIVIDKSKLLSTEMEEQLNTVKQMRNAVEKGWDMTLEARRDLMQNYYRALCVMESTFPISFCFTWYDSFNKHHRASEHNIHWEKAAIIFNLAAIHSQIAVSADGLNEACYSFQEAAGAFAFLRDHISVKASAGHSTIDVSLACTDMLERLMLAQAQECFFHMVISKSKRNSLISKIARQVSIYYHEAFVALNLPPLNQHFDVKWIAHVHVKAALFYAEASYRFSLLLHERKEIAEEIARLNHGLTSLAEAKKCADGLMALAPLLEMVSKLEGNIILNLKRATEENETIYFQIVPALDTLHPLPITCLVKSVAMDKCLDATEEIMFGELQLGPDFDQDQAASPCCSIPSCSPHCSIM